MSGLPNRTSGIRRVTVLYTLNSTLNSTLYSPHSLCLVSVPSQANPLAIRSNDPCQDIVQMPTTLIQPKDSPPGGRWKKNTVLVFSKCVRSPDTFLDFRHFICLKTELTQFQTFTIPQSMYLDLLFQITQLVPKSCFREIRFKIYLLSQSRMF